MINNWLENSNEFNKMIFSFKLNLQLTFELKCGSKGQKELDAKTYSLQYNMNFSHGKIELLYKCTKNVYVHFYNVHL